MFNQAHEKGDPVVQADPAEVVVAKFFASTNEAAAHCKLDNVKRITQGPGAIIPTNREVSSL
jgi:hypothetical protein